MTLGAINAPPRPLAILIYGVESSPVIASLNRKDVTETFESVGHHVSTCNNAEACRLKMESQHFDIVLADLPNAQALQQTLATGTQKTSVVPVLSQPTKEDKQAAKSSFGQVIDANASGLRMLPIVTKAGKNKP